MYTHAQAFDPTISVRTNSRTEDLIQVTITEKGAEPSLTMRRGSWLELLDLLAQEIMDRAESVKEVGPKPGDLCQFFKHDGQTLMRHLSCDEHGDGVVTNPATGRVVLV